MQTAPSDIGRQAPHRKFVLPATSLLTEKLVKMLTSIRELSKQLDLMLHT